MEHIFDLTTAQALGISLRSGIVYFAMLVLLRSIGKRHIGQLSIVDFVLVLLISNAVQNAMVGDNTTVPGGLVAAFTLIALSLFLNLLASRSDKVAHLLEGEPTLLIRDGQVLPQHLAREGINLLELQAIVREHGYAELADVRQAILEIDGSVSVIARSDPAKEHRLPPLRRHRTKAAAMLPPRR